jgi:hypothetical protein
MLLRLYSKLVLMLNNSRSWEMEYAVKQSYQAKFTLNLCGVPSLERETES